MTCGFKAMLKRIHLLKWFVLYCYTFYTVWLGKCYGCVPYLFGWPQPLSHLYFVPCYPHSNLAPHDGNTETAVILITLMETGFAPGTKDATFYLKITLFFPQFFTRFKIFKMLCAALEIEKS